jgi:hypothetical protein
MTLASHKTNLVSLFNDRKLFSSSEWNVDGICILSLIGEDPEECGRFSFIGSKISPAFDQSEPEIFSYSGGAIVSDWN